MPGLPHRTSQRKERSQVTEAADERDEKAHGVPTLVRQATSPEMAPETAVVSPGEGRLVTGAAIIGLTLVTTFGIGVLEGPDRT